VTLNWPNERYVRVYCRDTLNWIAMPWQGRALLPLLMRRLDREGRLNIGRHASRVVSLLSSLVGLPEDVVQVGFEALVEDGTIVVDIEAGVVLMPNFEEAQTAQASPAKRAKDYRDRHATKGDEPVTKRDGGITQAQDPVTERHAEQTAAFETVTPSRAVPSRAVLEDPPSPPAAAGGRESGSPAPEAREERSGRRRRSPAAQPPPVPATLTPAAARVVAEIREAGGPGYGPEACAELEARLRGEAPALTEDQALALVHWAAGDEYWGGKVQLAPNKLFAPKRVGELLARALAVERRRPAPAPEPPKDWEAEEERWDARRWWEQLPRDERDRVEDEATKRAVERWGSTHQSCIDRILVEMRREREAAERRPLEATG
jgi:hypothetical protein